MIYYIMLNHNIIYYIIIYYIVLYYIIIYYIIFHIMVTYLTDARLATVNRREGYVSWGVKNIFLIPAHNWIHDCIRNWTQKWVLALNMSEV